MKKTFKYTKDGIEVDISEAMKTGKEKKSYGSPEVSKHYFKSKEEAMKDGEKMGLKGVHSHKGEDGKVMYMAGPDHATFMKKHKEIMDKKAKAMDMKKEEKKMDAAYTDKKKTEAGYQDKKKAKAEMSPKQKGALDKNKDGKISKEDFEMLQKDKKESKSMHKDKDKEGKKTKPKMTYAQLLTDIAAKKNSDGV